MLEIRELGIQGTVGRWINKAVVEDDEEEEGGKRVYAGKESPLLLREMSSRGGRR
jgi:hypothetical protein